ncbi:hypothetical protein EVAR_14704_1 [Eumeta japonica]|uniref:Uncharacterized protein n=1 Tax=Eumeta variegata TaxID=151549 RepID=A0A4C1U273_EUMVA|nr:hypothetical protein EVAR_14704_1 [Eumeta japonica]
MCPEIIESSPAGDPNETFASDTRATSRETFRTNVLEKQRKFITSLQVESATHPDEYITYIVLTSQTDRDALKTGPTGGSQFPANKVEGLNRPIALILL